MLAGIIELGPSDNIALDQPRVAVELLSDADPGPGENWQTVGPTVFNTFLLDTGANSVLAMATAVSDMVANTNGYHTQGKFVETGVAGSHPLDISVPYQFDFAGTSGVRQTLNGTRILSDAENDFSMFGPWGLVGMPAMVNRVTSLDMTGWSGGGTGLEDLYMRVDFADNVPAENSPPGESHRYAVPVDNRLAFDPLEQVVSGDPPVWGDVPFLTAMPVHNGIGQEGNFLFDTGAQMSVISKRLALAIGLDSNGDGEFDEKDASCVSFETVGGVGGTVSAPVFAIDEVHLPATNVGSGREAELVWTDLQWLVLDIDTPPDQPSLDGVFGSDLLTSGWFHAFFYPGQPDGYIDQIHFDFRNMDNGSGTLYFDLNPDLDKIVEPGPGIRVRQTARSTEVVEGAETDTYTLVLQSDPSQPVTVQVFADDQTRISSDGGKTFASKLTLTFTDRTPQTITVQAVDDDLLEGLHSGVITHKVTSADSDYNGMAVQDVEVTIHDNDLQLIKMTSDAAGKNVIDSVEIAEGGPTATYWVSLVSPPSSEVWVVIEDAKSQCVPVNPHNSNGEGFENVVVFDASNWSQPQAVELTAVDDTLQEGPQRISLVHSVLDIANFLDPILGQNTLAVDIADNDLGGVIVTPATGGVKVTEGGATSTYQIALDAVPTGAVDIRVSADDQTLVSSDGGSTFVPELLLTFTDAKPKTVVVKAIDDSTSEGIHTGKITHAVTGVVRDARYPATLSIPSVTAEITDNDSSGLNIADANGSADVTEGGASDYYSVSLISQPTGDVKILLVADDQFVAVDDAHPANAFLEFSTSNWSVPQRVRVTAVDDNVVEEYYSGKLTHRVVSVDPNYQGSSTFPIHVTDNDTSGNSSPTGILLSGTTVVENVTGATIGTLSAVDPDAGQTHTFAVSDARFEVVSGKLKLKDGVSVDYEAGATIALDITASDSGIPVGTLSQTFTINVLANPRPWNNPSNALDVDGDTQVTPLDALVIINKLNSQSPGDPPGALPPTRPSGSQYYDVTGDGLVAPIDALLIINHLNAYGSGEGEAGSAMPTQLDAVTPPGLRSQTMPSGEAKPGNPVGLADSIATRDAESRIAAWRTTSESPTNRRSLLHRGETLPEVCPIDELLDQLAADIAAVRQIQNSLILRILPLGS